MFIMSTACDKGKKFWVPNGIQRQRSPEGLAGALYSSIHWATERFMVIKAIIDTDPAYMNYVSIIL